MGSNPWTLVSAILTNINTKRSIDEYIGLGKDLLSIPMPKVIFADYSLREHLESSEGGLTRFVWTRFEELPIALLESGLKKALDPRSLFLTDPKDTLRYLLLQCSKTHFVAEAARWSHFGSHNYIWLDYGMRKFFPSANSLSDAVLRVRDVQTLKIRLPHLWPLDRIRSDGVPADRVNWYFAGGIFGGSKEAVSRFNDRMREICKRAADEGWFTWEVNFWAMLYRDHPKEFEPVLAANHDRSLIDSFSYVQDSVAPPTSNDCTSPKVVYHAPPIRDGIHPVYALPRAEEVSLYESSGGAPELPLILWAETIVTKDAVLIDVGANVGTWSAIWGLLGHRAYPFEANPGMAALCNDTLRRNGLLENCKSYGLSDKSCTAVLRLPIDPNSPHGRGIVQDGGASLVSNFRGGDSSPLEVQLQTLDSFDFSSEREVFLKLDVEGAELDVLRGGRRFLETHRPKILFECWEDERGQRKEELFRFLHDELKYKTVKTSWPETWIAEGS